MPDKRFFCVRGFMKSGTNWLGSLLSSHEDISCVGEFHWQEITAKFQENLQSQPLFRDADLRSRAQAHFEEMIKHCIVDAAEPGAALVGDRTPTTITPLPLSDASYISIIRDGRDVLVSRAFHLYNHADVHRLFQRIPEMAETHQKFQADPWYFQKHPDQLLCHETMVRESMIWWRDHIHCDLEAKSKYPDVPIRFIRYEDLHLDTQRERHVLFEFLDVDPQRAAKIRGDLKPGFGTERPTEFLRKGAVGDWKNYFTEDTKKWFKEEAGQTLIDQGYADSMDW
jgi:hypothetical protein